jgi:hypothetical protein
MKKCVVTFCLPVLLFLEAVKSLGCDYFDESFCPNTTSLILFYVLYFNGNKDVILNTVQCTVIASIVLSVGE